MESDIVQMAACSLCERCRTGTTRGKESSGLKKTFQRAHYALLQLRTDKRGRGVKATVKGVTVIMQKHYLSLN